MLGKCDICGRDNVHVFHTFKKYKCKSCLDNSKTGVVGNSGMVYDSNINIESYKLWYLDGINLIKVPKSHPLFVKLFFDHYPKSKGIVGRSFNYLIYKDELPIGIIGFASPPLNYLKFNEYFNIDNYKKAESEKLFLNNNVFRLLCNEKNLGTQVLKLARIELYKYYYFKYNIKLKGIITFVEPPRTGSLYKADNWDFLGLTQGTKVMRRGEDWTEKKYTYGIKKYIYAYTYKKMQKYIV